MPPFNPPSEDFPSILKGKRILLTTESLGPVNGVSRTTGKLIEYLRRNGVDLAVVAPDFAGPSPLSSSSSSSSSSQPPHEQQTLRLAGYPLPYNPDLSLVYPFHLVHDIFTPTFQPDLIYIASPASLGFQVLLQLRQLQHPPPTLLNFQTDLSSYSEIIFPPFLAGFAVWLLSTVQGYLFNHPSIHTIFYPCSAVLTYLQTTHTPLSRTYRLGRGVDTTLFHPSHRSPSLRQTLAPNGETILLTVCRLAPEKGFEFLAATITSLLTSTSKPPPFKLVIVGGNPNPAVTSRIQALFSAPAIKSHVVFLGFLTGTDLARAYASADLFLHCSITETFGLVVLEAMASGVPVIARDQGGPSDIVRNQETGYLVPPGEVEVFAGLVGEVVRDERLRGKLGVRARAYAEEMTWEKIHRRVAGRMAEAMERRVVEGEVEVGSETALLEAGGSGSGRVSVSRWERIRLRAAVGVVYAMWVMAVVPLIVHGQRMVPRLLRRIPLLGRLVPAS
ncbi:UDP-Glycosyltransferase/glycogen phosphorylase [Aspergillus sclerotiicarbonarius CBS 121057]|uniref:UDP-Glycosyltransferase/glycogen phosphorylase n=1 Tax=Aspergillus sclerotiicarbonarius (strain CBS 121057 / IBT 28362) TaxID=1448318 RepID=A0A319DRY8_ASPSB|nr:UDP-Glycosyltransferase/glycogen phosphorylase [Aspergillus sclerotiicarbonarius CBS 121057]